MILKIILIAYSQFYFLFDGIAIHLFYQFFNWVLYGFF
jgi:hypothetical protein